MRSAPGVEMKVDAGWLLVRADDAHLDRAAAAGDFDVTRLLEDDRRREDPGPIATGLSGGLNRHGVNGGNACDEGLELGVERPRFVYVVLIDIRCGWASRGHALIMLAAPARAQTADIRVEAPTGASAPGAYRRLRDWTGPQPEGRRPASSPPPPPGRP